MHGNGQLLLNHSNIHASDISVDYNDILNMQVHAWPFEKLDPVQAILSILQYAAINKTKIYVMPF